MNELLKKLFDIKTVEVTMWAMIFCAVLLLATQAAVSLLEIPDSVASLFIIPLRVFYVSSLVLTSVLLFGNTIKFPNK